MAMISLIILLCVASLIAQTQPTPNPVTVLRLNGSQLDMGQTYGNALQRELKYSLDVLIGYFEERGSNYAAMLSGAEKFQERYSDEWDGFLRGMAVGSGLSHDDCKILNAMETLQVPEASENMTTRSPAKPDLPFGCAFAYIPGSRTSTGRPMIGRNYDYPPPFDKIARHLIVTILHDEGKIPTAIIGLPGQIYCPSCLNSNGVFLELNNGAPSGGGAVDQRVKPSMLVKMLDLLRDSSDFDQVSKALSEARSDYSLIVNAATPIGGASFEYSTENTTVRSFAFEGNENFVSTNFFLNPAWALPPPTDKATFIGVTRRDNLMDLLNGSPNITVDRLKEAMDVELVKGGAKWVNTIYQMVYDYESRVLFLKVPKTYDQWIDVDLNDLLVA